MKATFVIGIITVVIGLIWWAIDDIYSNDPPMSFSKGIFATGVGILFAGACWYLGAAS